MILRRIFSPHRHFGDFRDFLSKKRQFKERRREFNEKEFVFENLFNRKNRSQNFL